MGTPMKTMAVPTTKKLLVAAAGLALALTGAACSGDAGGSEASADAREARPTARAEGSGGTTASPVRLATAEFDVEGMTCGGCALATEMAVKKLDGVASADAEYDEANDEGRCTVVYDPSTVGTDRIAAAIEEAGFTPSLASEPTRSPAPSADRGGR